MNVKVNVSVLNNEVSNIDSYCQELNDSINSIKSVVESFGNAWAASAYTDTFVPKMEEFVNELSKIREQVISYKEFVYGYASSETTLDNSYSAKSINLE